MLSGRSVATTPASSPLRLHALNALLDRALPGKTKPRFSVFGGSTGPYTPHPDFWLPDIDLSCAPTGQSAGDAFFTQPRGCLLTPSVFVTAAHVFQAHGPLIWFVGNNGQAYSRTVVNSDDSLGWDIDLILLDTPLPVAVRPAKLLPSDVASYIGPNDFSQRLDTVVLDSESKAISFSWVNLSNAYVTANSSIGYLSATHHPSLIGLTESVVVGDSGSPMFLIIDDEPVLVTCWHTAGYGPAYHSRLSAIQAIITAWRPGETISTIDLSEFAL